MQPLSFNLEEQKKNTCFYLKKVLVFRFSSSPALLCSAKSSLCFIFSFFLPFFIVSSSVTYLVLFSLFISPICILDINNSRHELLSLSKAVFGDIIQSPCSVLSNKLMNVCRRFWPYFTWS